MPIVDGSIVTDQDQDPKDRALKALWPVLVQDINLSNIDAGALLSGGFSNMYVGHGEWTTSDTTETITIGITMPHDDYAVHLTMDDSGQDNVVRIHAENRTTTTFDAIRSNNQTSSTQEFSWAVFF